MISQRLAEVDGRVVSWLCKAISSSVPTLAHSSSAPSGSTVTDAIADQITTLPEQLRRSFDLAPRQRTNSLNWLAGTATNAMPSLLPSPTSRRPPVLEELRRSPQRTTTTAAADRCCDHRMNPSSTHQSGSPSGWPPHGSTARPTRSATPTTTPWPKSAIGLRPASRIRGSLMQPDQPPAATTPPLTPGRFSQHDDGLAIVSLREQTVLAILAHLAHNQQENKNCIDQWFRDLVGRSRFARKTPGSSV